MSPSSYDPGERLRVSILYYFNSASVCEIRSSHGGEYEVFRPLGCDAMRMEATCSPDTSVNIHHTTRCRSPENTDSWLRLGSMPTREMISVIWIKIYMPNDLFGLKHTGTPFSQRQKWQPVWKQQCIRFLSIFSFTQTSFRPVFSNSIYVYVEQTADRNLAILLDLQVFRQRCYSLLVIVLTNETPLWISICLGHHSLKCITY